MFSLDFKPVVWMVSFSAVHVSLLETLIRQCGRTSGAAWLCPRPEDRRPVARLTRLAKFNRTYHWLMCAYYVFTLAKYALIWLLGFEWLHDYRHLDCLLIGRLNFIGRTMKVGRVIGKLAAGMFLFYRTRVTLLGPELFKFHCLEFLLYDYNDILVNEIRARERDQVVAFQPGGGGGNKIYGSKSSSSNNKQPMVAAPSDNLNTSRRSRMANIKGKNEGRNRTIVASGRLATAPTTTIRYEFLHENRQLIVSRRHDPAGPARDGHFNRNFYLRNPFSNGQAEDEYILRLNRTSKSWLTLANYANLSFYYSVLFTIFFIGLIDTLISGSVLTKIGFELNYPNCVRWLRDQQQQQQNRTASPSYTYLYKVNTTRRLASEWHIDSIPFRIPLDDNFPAPTVYSVLRITYDILENHFWYLDFFGVFMGLAFNSYLMTLDLLINARAIKSRLKVIIAGLHERTHLGGPRGKYTSLEGAPKTLQLGEPGRQADAHLARQQIVHQDQYCALRALHAKKMHDSEVEISHIQAILLDHFNMTRDYNSYTSFFLLFCTCAWFNYTVIMCFWMGIVRSKSIEFEFAWAEAVTFVILLSLLVGSASIRTSNYRLYALITDAMALDDNLLVSKERWSMIIQYFYPKPMFCFTLFSSIELSWLFCLKLTSWIISAILVLANFFYMYKA